MLFNVVQQFVDGEALVVFGVVDIIVVGRGVVDVVKTSPISPIAINTTDKVMYVCMYVKALLKFAYICRT